jgi:hypothetical protein
LRGISRRGCRRFGRVRVVVARSECSTKQRKRSCNRKLRNVDSLAITSPRKGRKRRADSRAPNPSRIASFRRSSA